MKIFIYSISIILSAFCYAQESPNFLWLVCEDQSLFFSIYGDSSSNTPNINQLADGIVYQNCYTPSPVCAPSRSSLSTGMYPTTLGTQHMRAYGSLLITQLIHIIRYHITVLNQLNQFVFSLKTLEQTVIIVRITLKKITICSHLH